MTQHRFSTHALTAGEDIPPSCKTVLDQDWVSAKKACAYLECTFPTLKRWINDGKLQASQITPKGKIRVSASSIEMLLNRGGTV